MLLNTAAELLPLKEKQPGPERPATGQVKCRGTDPGPHDLNINPRTPRPPYEMCM